MFWLEDGVIFRWDLVTSLVENTIVNITIHSNENPTYPIIYWPNQSQNLDLIVEFATFFSLVPFSKSF